MLSEVYFYYLGTTLLCRTFGSLSPLLVQRSRIQHRPIPARHKLMRQMRRIVERQLTPPIHRIQRRPGVVLQRRHKRIQPVIVSSRAVGDVPRESWIVQLCRVDLAFVQGSVTLVDVHVAGEDQVDLCVVEDVLKDVFALRADGRRLVLRGDVPRAVAGDNDPRRLLAVDRRKVRLKPIALLIHERGKRAAVLTLAAAGLVGGDEAVSKIGLGVERDEVHHAVVVRVPEVVEAAALRAGHAEMVAEAGEVGLARHADRDVVRDVVRLVCRAAVVAVGLVIARADHVRLDGGDRGQFIVECVQNLLVHFGAACSGGIGQETLDFFLEPVIGVRNVAG